ncbi:uncharacterized protein BCR38DRAFT_418164 [Pseudomassariella vexata]|uniref:SnoaL-like domain-containing protein n=1 Tax=Pseudomassariella vexata TaxID=1141098 RepID=A0A1Y2EKL0_9PEZI|nr:uncharacterized protein BCR38DRAFT_418164 [Pseudomassariella vexata]ORY71826.1 hypothetical protein BCR38DRAFT_418164 [Pseudomassariella vexata]
MSQRRQTALAAIDSYNQWSISAIMAFRDPSCTHEILPKSLNQPLMDNKKYEAYFSSMIPAFKSFKVVVQDVFEDEKENKVVVWAESTADSVIGPYANEYMLAFYFNEAGDKVVRMLEFVDSKNSAVFFPKLKGWFEERAAEGSAGKGTA